MRRFLLALAAMILLPATAQAATLHATPSTFASTYSNAQGGDTILLASGSYGSWAGGAKPSMVTVAPEVGAAVSFSGVDFPSTVRNLTIQGVTYTGQVRVNPPSGTKMNLIFDGDTWGAINRDPNSKEGRLAIIGGGGPAIGANGVQVKNSTFGPGGCSDGVEDGSSGTEIGPGNEFKNITQSCSASLAHVDAIQPYGSNYTWIHDNYMHDNEQGIMSPDGPATGYLFENNVIQTTNGYPCITIGYGISGTVRHNTCLNGNVRVYGGNQNTNSRNMRVQDNSPGVNVTACTTCIVDHNQQVTYTNTGTGRCHYATASPKGTASDGTDIGLNDCANQPPPPVDHTPAGAFTYTPGSPTVGQAVTFDVSGSTCEDTPCSYTLTDEQTSGSFPIVSGAGPTLTFTFTQAHPSTAPVHATLRVTDVDGDVSAAVSHDIIVTDTAPPPPTSCDQACIDAYEVQIADLTQQLADMTTSRDNVQTLADAYKARAEKAEATLAQIHTLSAP